MAFHNFLSLFIISLGAAVAFRILFVPIQGSEVSIAATCCIGLIGVASYLLRHG